MLSKKPSLRGIAVIGANYGDEGKGVTTDALASALGAGTVVRFNGGAQSTHTVVCPDGKRHAFSHVGSGAFAGAQTYLSKYFICNPGLFYSEWNALCLLGLRPVVHLHREALVTTPWDEATNQFIELGRGGNRHGSCGLGINETVERNLRGPGLKAWQLYDAASLSKALPQIVAWFSNRIWDLQKAGAFAGLTEPQEKSLKLLLQRPQKIGEQFIQAVEHFKVNVNLASELYRLDGKPVLFEGGQGLLLDQEKGTFPHVTRSYTGLRNVMEICDEEGIELVESVFVTRHYMTRHGAGPLPGEGSWRGVVDDLTNTPNTYQGFMRTGLLDWHSLHFRIRKEMIGTGMGTQCSICVTHCDNIKFPYNMQIGAAEWEALELDERDFECEVRTGYDKAYFSYGRTRSTFKVRD